MIGKSALVGVGVGVGVGVVPPPVPVEGAGEVPPLVVGGGVVD